MTIGLRVLMVTIPDTGLIEVLLACGHYSDPRHWQDSMWSHPTVEVDCPTCVDTRCLHGDLIHALLRDRDRLALIAEREANHG